MQFIKCCFIFELLIFINLTIKTKAMQEILKQCTVKDKTVFLPNQQLERKDYQSVAKALEGIGGKWNRKAGGFIFVSDPTELLAKIQGGDKINLKKEYQFFATPDHLADRLVELADIQESEFVLEPSAGKGAILKAIRQRHRKNQVDCVELMTENAWALTDLINTYNWAVTTDVFEEDFLKMEEEAKYNKIVANPPFSKNQDIDHVLKMWQMLEKGGRIVSVMSNHWRNCENRKESEFKEWLESVGGEIQEIEAGTFKESGTNIAACIVIIEK